MRPRPRAGSDGAWTSRGAARSRRICSAPSTRRDATGERRQPADERSRPSTSTKRGRVGSVSESETPIEMAFTVYNPNIEPYVVTEIGYDITMNGVEMGSGQTDEGYSIPSYSTETVEFTTALQNRHLDDWWVTHLDEEVRGHQVTGLRIEFYAVIEFPTGEEAHHSAGCAHLRGDDRDGRKSSTRVTTCETPASRRRTGQTTAVTETTAARLRTEQPTAATRPTAETKRTTATPPKNGTDDGRRTEPTTATTGFAVIIRRPVRPSPRRPD